jgi:O-antigen/teichoic acid export membrane protein
MTARTAIFRGGLKLGAGQVLVQACSFVRTVIVGQIIGKTNFGIAAVFVMTVALLDMISNLSLDAMIVQSKEGGSTRFQRTAQLLQVLRGLVNAALLFALAGPVSSLFGIPEARWAFSFLAVIPLLNGFVHLDVYRLQRRMRVGPAVAVEVGSSLLVAAAAWPLAAWLRDYRAMLWLLIFQAAATVAGSHVAARRRYAWAWLRQHVRSMVRFGWPLLVNGILMFVIFQGDGFVIGSSGRLFEASPYTVGDLGVYSAAFLLTMAPAVMIGRVFWSLFLPLLSQVQDDREALERRYSFCALVTALAAGLFAIPFIAAGGWLVVRVFGAGYGEAAAFIGILAAMQALRIVRVAPTLAAMSRGDTRNSMVSNLTRSLALAGVLAVAASGGSLRWIAAAGVGGEILALVVCVLRLRRHHAILVGPCLKPAAISAAVILLAALLSQGAGGAAGAGWFATLLVALGLAALLCLAMLVAFPWLRREFLSAVAQPRARAPLPMVSLEVEPERPSLLR